MKQIVLAGSQIGCSRFIFGTASLFNVGQKKQRVALLEAAVENGFTHFDTAPYYGFGMAERDLSGVLKLHPNVTLTTKVGLYSPGGDNGSFVEIFMRKAAGRLLPALSRPTVDFTLQKARKSLEGSLRRLGRDHIDLYMLHEPPFEMVQTDEWLLWLEGLVKSRIVRAFGLAGTSHRIKPFLDAAPSLAPIVQVLDSLDLKEADLLREHGKPLQITYGYVSAAKLRGDQRPVVEILRSALQRNLEGAIIVSTKRPGRLAQYRQLSESEHD